MNKIQFCVTLCLGLSISGAARAGTYAEAANGDLSNDRLLPTLVALDRGANAISATSVASDVEYFRVNVPVGSILSAVKLTAFTSGTNVSFVGVQRGTTFSCPASGAGACGAANLLGWAHIGAAQLGSDVLDDMGRGAGALGFVPPLAAGDYTFWAQETAGSPSSYTLEFTLAAAPASAPIPAVFLGALALGLGGIGAQRLRRKCTSA